MSKKDMKNKDNLIFGLLVVALCVGIVFPSIASAADNESVLLTGYDIHEITTDGLTGTNYVSDPNFKTDFVTLNIPNITVPTTDTYGDAAYGMSFVNDHLFIAAGEKDDTGDVTGGLELFDSAYNRVGAYGEDGAIYHKVFARDDRIIFLAYFDTTYAPEFEAVDYVGSSIVGLSRIALEPAASAADITALSVFGDYAYVGLEDNGSGLFGGAVNVVDISEPAMLDATTPGVYYTSDAVTAVAGNGTVFYVGHGNDVDVVDTATQVQIGGSIDTGAMVNDLVTDGTYFYVANDTNGLRVYNVSDLSLAGEYVAVTGDATAVSATNGFIYLATSNGTDSEIFKIKMVAFTLNPDLPFTELGHNYVDPGAIASDGSEVISDASTAVDVDTIGSYTVTYTTETSFLKMTREVEVRDTTAPIITLVAPNPQTVLINTSYVELGANADDGSLVDISGSVDANTLGTYHIYYDSVDASGNHATQVERTINVVASAYTINASAGAGGSISPLDAVVVAEGNNQTFDITPDVGYHVLNVLVDGVSVGAVASYTFTNVVASHTIAASFEVNPDSFTITTSVNGHGSINPSGAVVVNAGNDQTFTITPDSGHRIANVLVDDVSVGKVSTYTFTGVIADHTIHVNFSASPSGGSSGAGNSSDKSEIPGCGMRIDGYSTVSGVSCANNIPHEEGQVLGAEKFVFTVFLKMGHPPYPIGAYANEVMELQKFLNAAPYNSGLVVDGKFGPLTNAAVIKFQLANGLVGDGLVGPLTRAVLNK